MQVTVSPVGQGPQVLSSRVLIVDYVGYDDSACPSALLPTWWQIPGRCSREVSITPPLHPHQGWVTLLCPHAHPCPLWSVLTTVVAHGYQNQTGTITKKEMLRVSLTESGPSHVWPG